MYTLKLTIVLPTAGRPAFTKRFFSHTKRLPFQLLLDEGDAPLPVDQWFAKVRDTLERVDTPYAMLCDNDDLPTADVARCVEFLENHKDYVCCSGRIQGFHMWPDPLCGPHSAVTEQYAPYDTPTDYGQADMNERVLAGFANSWSHYAVYRTGALQQIWQEVCALRLTNLQVHEKFCAMRTLMLGKALCSPDFTTLYRQYGTSQNAAFKPPNVDFDKVLAVLQAEGFDDAATLRRLWLQWYATRDRYFQGRWRKPLKAMLPGLARLMQNRHRYLPHQSLPV